MIVVVYIKMNIGISLRTQYGDALRFFNDMKPTLLNLQLGFIDGPGNIGYRFLRVIERLLGVVDVRGQ